MQFFTEAVNVLKTLVIALGAGLAVWGLPVPHNRLTRLIQFTLTAIAIRTFHKSG